MNNMNIVLSGTDFSKKPIPDGGGATGDYKVFQEYIDALTEIYQIDESGMNVLKKLLGKLAPFKNKMESVYLFLGDSEVAQTLNLANPSESPLILQSAKPENFTNTGFFLNGSGVQMSTTTVYTRDRLNDLSLLFGINDESYPQEIPVSGFGYMGMGEWAPDRMFSFNRFGAKDGAARVGANVRMDNHPGGRDRYISLGGGRASSGYSKWHAFVVKKKDEISDIVEATIMGDRSGEDPAYKQNTVETTMVNPGSMTGFLGNWGTPDGTLRAETVFIGYYINPTDMRHIANALEEFNKYRRVNGI